MFYNVNMLLGIINQVCSAPEVIISKCFIGLTRVSFCFNSARLDLDGLDWSNFVHILGCFGSFRVSFCPRWVRSWAYRLSWILSRECVGESFCWAISSIGAALVWLGWVKLG